MSKKEDYGLLIQSQFSCLRMPGLLFTLEDFLPLIMEVPHSSEVEKILCRRIELKF